ncbi:MAG: arsenite methyltransferase [Armatimonadota bacterium]|nr:arsenite methyltransferase [Armatimonadota bacterium]
MDEQAIRTAVRERYAKAAMQGAACCGETAAPAGAGPSCCGTVPLTFSDGRPVPDDLAAASLGCGAPIEAAALQPGEIVVDLGSGAGLDVFLAADRVGPTGRAIGVDMTPEMIATAQANASRLGLPNVEFRLGEIEHLPLADQCADVVISNCVINLLPDKRRAFTEAYRVLRPGGRMVVSDIVTSRPVPSWLVTAERWAACLGGAIPERDYLAAIREAGFADVEVLSKSRYAGRLFFSATVRAVKPPAA